MCRKAARALLNLAAEAFDAAFVAMSSLVSDRAVDELRARVEDGATLTEIAEHLGAIRALLEDTRNLLQLGVICPICASPKHRHDPNCLIVKAGAYTFTAT